jgi:glycerol uptake facilitator-like aquaporin
MSSTNSSNGLKILMEFIGTFILSAAINLSTSYSDGQQTPNPLLIILSFFTAITITRAISGGHINPAVTLAVYIEKPSEVRSKDQPLLTLYVLAQVLGALSACFFSYIFYRENVFKLAISDTTIPFHALIIETLATGIFIYTILCQGKLLLISLR